MRQHESLPGSAKRRVLCPPARPLGHPRRLPDLYGNVLEIWKAWADDLRGAPIASGHHMAEGAPDALAAELLAFLDESH